MRLNSTTIAMDSALTGTNSTQSLRFIRICREAISTIVAALLCSPVITLVACHRINRYNDMRTGKGKGFRTLIFCREPYPETIIKNMVIISKYEVEYKKGEDIFDQQ